MTAKCKTNGIAKRRKTGAPPKFTKKRREIILRELADGQTIGTAADMAGIDQRTIHRWKEDPKKASFRRGVARARASAKKTRVGLIGLAARRGEWKAAAWLLERMNPDEFGKSEKVELSGTVTLATMVRTLNERSALTG